MRRSPLKRGNYKLKTRKPLRAHKPINRVSEKQKVELRERARVKAELVKEAPKDDRGVPLCADCGKPVDWDWRSPSGDLSHTKRLSDCGKTTKENGRLLCRNCHNTFEHHLREIM